MKTEHTITPVLDLESVLADENLTRLRRAYHALEGFQLSPAHSTAKEKLKTALSHAEASGSSEE